MKSLGFILIFLMGFVCPANLTGQNTNATTPVSQEIIYPQNVVAADHPAASQVGADILRKGGNVVDAAVATSFALSVVRPSSCGIGGGGFMVIWNAKKQEAVAVDYRERAPRAATRDMFVDRKNPGKARDELSRRGHLAVAVPGTVAGLCYVLEHYGSMDLKSVLEPAIRLAGEGVLIDEHDRGVQMATLADLERLKDERGRYGTLTRRYLNGGKPWKPGDRFHSPLRPVLERIAAKGKTGFYGGAVAVALVVEMRRGGGLITLKDLASTKPIIRSALRGSFDGYDILTMPPPSSGGVALLQTLNILTAYEQEYPKRRLEKLGHGSPDYYHLLTEAMKHSFADRAEYLGDADFSNVPVDRLVSREYGAELAKRIEMSNTKPLEAYGRFLPVEDGGTSHFSIIDSQGNAVACTETINTLFGSYVVEPKFGIVLNNEMDDFAAVPGIPNAFGLMQSEANAVGPGRKPLSSMSPTIVVERGKAKWVIGASGGPRIISSTLQVLLNGIRFAMQPGQAVNEPRIHHQWLPNHLYLEQPLFGKIALPLRSRGHEVRQRNDLAVSQAASRSIDGLRGASDRRKHGQPAGN